MDGTWGEVPQLLVNVTLFSQSPLQLGAGVSRVLFSFPNFLTFGGSSW